MLSAVGRETGWLKSFPVSESDIRRWAVAVYWPDEPPRLFWDSEFALETRYSGIVAPEEFNPFAWLVADKKVPSPPDDPNDPDRTERLLGIEGPGLKFMLNGGIEVVYGVRIRPGDVIESTGRVAGYYERAGRLGLMLFTINEDTWTNQYGDLVKRTRSTLIRY